MKKIILLIVSLLLLTSCVNNDETSFIYTVTDFETIETDGFNDHFNTKKAGSSKVYKINFNSREDFSREIVTESEEEIVYHDFCKSPDGVVYAVGGEFGVGEGSARIVQVYPKTENQIIQKFDEIRIRDCAFIENGEDNYVGLVSHGEGKAIVYDMDKKEIVSDINSEYSPEYDDITMIHEVVKADLDGDGVNELYYAPTTKNVSTDKQQKGKIYKLELIDGKYVKSEVDDLGDRYTKEVHTVNVNGKDAILISTQGQTNSLKYLREESKKVRDLQKEGNYKLASKIKKPKKLINPVELYLYYSEKGEIKKEKLGEIQTSQCRTIETGNFGYKGQGIVVGCKNGTVNFYSLNSTKKLELKESLSFPGKQVHSFLVTDTDNDNTDEVFIGVDFDGFYHLDLGEKEDNKLFKMYDYSDKESWIWAIEGL